MRKRTLLAIAVALGATVGTVPGVASAACDPIDPSACMLPFPNDFFTKADRSTPTGRRVAFDLTSMPRNVAGKPIDPTDWNRADGFSPGSQITTYVPGLDLAKTGGVPITDIGAYSDSGAPVVVIDAASARRWPIWTELDQSVDYPTLLIRPAKNFREGHRYIVALRAMKDAQGNAIAAGSGFKAFRDGTAGCGRATPLRRLFPNRRAAGSPPRALSPASRIADSSWQPPAA